MKSICILFLGLFIMTSAAVAGPNSQSYYEIEIKARELTLESMEKRLACMNDNCPLADQFAIDEEYIQKIDLMHEGYSTTPSQLAAWYTQHAKEAESYFLTSPRLQIRLDELNISFDTLSDSIKTLLEAQQ